MFGFKFKRNKYSLKEEYDRQLVEDVELAKNEWENIRTNDDLLATMSMEDYLISEQLARAKFEFLFHEAKIRQVKAKIQESVIVRQQN